MTARTYLVAYDIRSPRRLARVHKALSKVGYHLQYSVFAVDLEEWERTKLVSRLRRLIDEKVDDVRFYLVPAEARGAWAGPVPASALFSVSGAPAATLARRLARQEGLRSGDAAEEPGP